MNDCWQAFIAFTFTYPGLLFSAFLHELYLYIP
jgi:hypothetical protein